MCDPVTIGASVAALAVADAGLSYIGQNQAASANKKAANFNYANDVTTLSQKASQLDQERSEKALDTAIAAVRSEGSIAASAGSQGLGSQSIVQQLNAGMFGIGRQATSDDINDRNARQQLGAEGTGAQISRQNQILQKPKAGVASLVIGVGKGALSGATAYRGAGGR